MNFFAKTLCVAALMLTSMAQAEFLTYDALSTGDNGSLYDTQSGLEWLSLKHTDGYSHDVVSSYIQPGGLLEGWRLPTQSEYVDMVVRFFDTPNIDHALLNGNYSISAPSDKLTAWATFFSMTYGDRSMGYLKEDGGSVRIAGVFNGAVNGIYDYDAYSPSKVYKHYGVYLVSDTDGVSLSSQIGDLDRNVTEGASDVPVHFALGGLALLGLGLRRRQLVK